MPPPRWTGARPAHRRHPRSRPGRRHQGCPARRRSPSSRRRHRGWHINCERRPPPVARPGPQTRRGRPRQPARRRAAAQTARRPPAARPSPTASSRRHRRCAIRRFPASRHSRRHERTIGLPERAIGRVGRRNRDGIGRTLRAQRLPGEAPIGAAPHGAKPSGKKRVICGIGRRDGQVRQDETVAGCREQMRAQVSPPSEDTAMRSSLPAKTVWSVS